MGEFEDKSNVVDKSATHVLILAKVPQETQQIKIARIVVALITLLGIREEVYRMLR